jgi:hypothetical protein
MPPCRQCGKENPEGTVFCGYCATRLEKPADNPTSSAGGDPTSSPLMREVKSPQSKPLRRELRTPVIHTPAPSDAGKGKGGGFELLPWSELSGSQRMGRSIAALVFLFLVFFFFRTIIRGIGASGTSGNVPSAQSTGAPITPGDRRDGIESLCKVFQIYGLPKTDRDATEAAHNAGELFKLAGNQSPERSAYILNSIVQEFRGGKLSQSDCAEAGAPLATTGQSSDNSTPEVER